MPIIALETIRHNGKVFSSGQVLSIGQAFESRLVSLKAAEFVPETEESAHKEELTFYEYDPEDYEDLRKSLDESFNRDPLATAARAAGVQFENDAKKAVIIDAVITQGKAEKLLGEE